MPHPEYTRAERIADGCIHFAGIAASLIAMAILIFLALRHLPASQATSLAVYAAGAIAMFGFSAAYNMVNRPRLKAWLRHCDHSAIFLMIAGTYTPLAWIMIGGSIGVTLLVLVWAITVIGIALKFAAPRLFDRLSVALYLLQGWTVLGAGYWIVPLLPAHILWLLAIGGGLYTAGVGFHLWRRLPFQNAVWHGFVLAAASVHYAAMVQLVA